MIQLNRVAFLIAVPVMALALSIACRVWAGPFWMGLNLDPDYAYLMNALNLAKGMPVGHVDHPGTPVQLFGAVVLAASQWIGSGDLAETVTTHAETYLWILATLFSLLTALALWYLGKQSYAAWGSWQAALMVQLSVLGGLATVSNDIHRFNPEPLLVVIGAFVCATLIRAVAGGAVTTRTDLLLGFFCGVGVAVKVTFLPIPAAVMLTRAGISRYWTFGAATILGFFVGTLPIVSMYPVFGRWIYGLLTHTGRYGAGEEGIIASQKWFAEIGNILVTMPAFPLAVLLGVVSAVYLSTDRAAKAPRRLMVCFGLMVLFQVLMVAKHPEPRYLMPAIPAAAALIGVSVLHLQGRTQPSPFRLVVAGALLLLLLPAGRTLLRNVEASRASVEEFRQLETKIRDLGPTCTMINHYRASSPAYALYFGDQFAGNARRPRISALYPHHYVYDIWPKILHKGGATTDFESLLLLNSCVAMQGSSGTRIDLNPGIKTETVFSGKVESLTRFSGEKTMAVGCSFRPADGFYPRESSPNHWHVWTGLRGQFEAVVGQETKAVIEAQIESMVMPNKVSILLNGELLEQREFPKSSNKKGTFNVTLKRGMNALAIVSAKPGVSANGDSRQLAVLVADLKIKTEGEDCKLQ